MAKKIEAYIKLQVPAGVGKSKPACWSGSRSARPEYHGVLQGIQRRNSGYGTGYASTGNNHCVCG